MHLHRKHFALRAALRYRERCVAVEKCKAPVTGVSSPAVVYQLHHLHAPTCRIFQLQCDDPWIVEWISEPFEWKTHTHAHNRSMPWSKQKEQRYVRESNVAPAPCLHLLNYFRTTMLLQQVLISRLALAPSLKTTHQSWFETRGASFLKKVIFKMLWFTWEDAGIWSGVEVNF